MTLYSQIDGQFQFWIDLAIENSQNPELESESTPVITIYALVLAAMKNSPEIQEVFNRNLTEDNVLEDFYQYLEIKIKGTGYKSFSLTGKDEELDSLAHQWVSGMKESDDVVKAWLLFFKEIETQITDNSTRVFPLFFNIENIVSQIKPVSIPPLFNENDTLSSKVMTAESFRIFESASEYAGKCKKSHILPIHVLYALIDSNSASVERLFRKNIPLSGSVNEIKEILQINAPVLDQEAPPLELRKSRMAPYTLEKLDDAALLAAQRNQTAFSIIPVDLLAGVLQNDEIRHRSLLKDVLDKCRVNFNKLIKDARYEASMQDSQELPFPIPSEICGTDMTWNLSNKKIEPKKGFEEAIRNAVKTIFKKKRNSVLIRANSGVGRTSFIEQFCLSVSEDEQSLLGQKKVISLDCKKVAPESKKDFLNNVLQFGYGKKDVVICIDGLEAILSNDEEAVKNTRNFIDQFSYYMQSQQLQLICLISPGTFINTFGLDTRIHTLFSVFDLPEPTGEQTRAIIFDKKEDLETKLNISICDEAIDKAILVTEQYSLSEYFPKKALALIEEAADSKSYEIARSEKVRLEVSDIVETFAARTNIPEETLMGETADNSYEAPLAESIKGQPEAIQTCANELSLIKSGMKDPEKPASVMMFAGMTGTGKTELAKSIARIYSATKRYVPFTMGNFSESHTISGLIGVPAGYVGSDQGGPLINEINKDPYCVILFDEIEKAHSEVLKPLLNLFDEGWIVDRRNTKANAQQSIFILTSNVGSEVASSMFHAGADYKEIQTAVKHELLNKRNERNELVFSSEFLARIQNIIVFRPLNKETLKQILIKMISKKAESLRHYKKKVLKVDDEVIDLLNDECFRRYEETSGKAGGRVVLRVITEYIENLIQKIPASHFKQISVLELKGNSLNTLKFEYDFDMTKEEIILELNSLLEKAQEEARVKVNEAFTRFERASSLYTHLIDMEQSNFYNRDQVLEGIGEKLNELKLSIRNN